MSIAVPPILYREQAGRCTAPAEIDRAVAELSRGQTQYAACDLAERIRLIDACIEGTVRTDESWVSAACQAKRVAIDSAAGPPAVCRYLRLLRESLTDVQQFGHPRLPGQVYTSAEGRLRAAVSIDSSPRGRGAESATLRGSSEWRPDPQQSCERRSTSPEGWRFSLPPARSHPTRTQRNLKNAHRPPQFAEH